ncbi:MAG: hypothetical protein DLM66_12810 [Candidatus Dormiibacter spiritus]|nr:MAG: hypothetical protein DLM66_12810 [Candidatus Dormibacteraeota bacterium]
MTPTFAATEARAFTMAAMPLLPVQDAAAEVEVSVRTVWNWIRAERIASYRRKGDRRTFVDLEQVRNVVGFRRISGPEPGTEKPDTEKPDTR